MTEPLDAHRALVAKVDAWVAQVAARRASDMRCRAGCDACCHTRLTVSPVEASLVRDAVARLAEEERAELAERAEQPELAHRCAMLRADGRCAIYQARPLVCRTQGLPLRYPAGLVPEATVRARAKGGEITWCPLNFEARPPDADDVLDAERLDTLLALTNRAFVDARGGDPLERVELASLLVRTAGG